MTDGECLRIAAVADVHFTRTSQGTLQTLFATLAESADVLLLCGDLTHHGLPEEAAALAKELSFLRIPILSVLGNHDCHADQQEDIHRIMIDAGVHALDGDAVEIGGIGFAGVKGFASGFGRRVLEPWGESIVKQFVHEAVNEALKLESALARLSTSQRVAVLHYAPISETVEGEPLEIYPFLGSSRLEDPINRFKVAAAFHGHAHHGRAEGRTSTGIPVYNVSMPLMRSLSPDGPPYRIVVLPLVSEEDAGQTGAQGASSGPETSTARPS